MKEMSCFSDDTPQEWFRSIAGENAARVAMKEAKQLSNLSGDALFEALEKKDANKPVAMLRGLHNAMMDAGNYNVDVMLWLFNSLTPQHHYVNDSIDSNTILQCNVISKLQKLVKIPNFTWNTLIAVKSSEDYDRLIELLSAGLTEEDTIFAMKHNLTVERFRQYRKAKKLGMLIDDSSLDDRTVQCAVMRFCDNTINYEVPTAALSALYVLRELGLPIDRLQQYEDMYHYKSFWKDTIQLKDVIFEIDESNITKDHLSNLKNITDLLMCDRSIWRYGDDPIMSLLLEKARIHKGLPARSTVEQRSAPLSTARRYYLNINSTSVKLFEADAGYLWKNLDRYLNSVYSNPRLADADIRRVSQEILVNFITFDTTTINTDYYKDRYIDIADTLAKFSFENLIDLLKPMYSIGKQLSCYNWNLLYIIYVLIKKELPFKEWIKIYLGDSASFSTFVLTAALAMMLGSSDYEDIFREGYTGFRKLQACYQTISPNYNFATAAILHLLGNLNIDCSNLPRTKTIADNFVLIYKDTTREYTVADVASGLAQKQMYLLKRAKCSFHINDNKLVVTVNER